MRSEYQILNSVLTAIGIGCSLLAAMLIIEYTIMGNLNNILVYGAISLVIANSYLIIMITSSVFLKRKPLNCRIHNHKLNTPS